MQNQPVLQPQQPSRKPSKTAKRLFGWTALLFFVLTVLTPQVTAHGLFLIATLVSFVLWIAAYRGYRQVAAPPLLDIQKKQKPTAQDIYLEEALLRQAAQQQASAAALQRMQAVPDQADGLMIVGVAIDPEQFPQQSVLHRRVIQRERWTRVALAVLAFFGGGGR